MSNHRWGRLVRLGFLTLFLGLISGPVCPIRPARAESLQNNNTSSELLSYALWNTRSPGSQGSPVFLNEPPFNGIANPFNGMLMSTGSSQFPDLTSSTTPTPPTTPNSITQSYLVSGLGDFTQVISANQTLLPSGFGTATVSASVSEALPIANNATGENQQVSGVAFNSSIRDQNGNFLPGTLLQSGATLPAGQQAAVSFTHLHADFTNKDSSTFTALPGAAISANGFVSQTPASFVELAVQGTITIKGSSNPFTMIAALDNNNNKFTYVDPTGTISLTTGQGNFSVTGTDNFAQVDLNQNEGFSVDANLTLVSDPGSLIQISSLSDVPGRLPNIGAFVGGSAVPEPSSLVVFGTGLLMLAGCWGWRRDRRRKRQRLDSGENETSGYTL